ncbi:MAG TPA: SDR family oxidoreductase [Opitutaceae bacterium]|nr:SDR family oxidoreductase [Opitutaceae bacterium]HRJ46654.1 SDR family oxidoreductase [Opitutaceae bacterium]
MRLKDKVIIVTGGTSGIGRAIAERCVAEGARVLVHGLDRAEGEALVAKLGVAAALQIDDLVDPAAPARIVAAAVAAFGKVTGLVNNAAIVPRETLHTITPEKFERTMAINVRAPLFLIQAAFPHLQAQQGSVLNIGSINALSGEATFIDYSISKGALQTLSRNLANAHGTDRVRFTHFNVGWVLTAREQAAQVAQGLPADWAENLPPLYAPSGRLIQPEEIAAAAVYWLGDESGPITGTVLELEQFSVYGRNPVKTKE